MLEVIFWIIAIAFWFAAALLFTVATMVVAIRLCSVIDNWLTKKGFSDGY